MDVGYFLRDRIAFVRQFFTAASGPFVARQRKIQAHEDPFVPPYSEDDEPPFLDEWIEADESLQVLGYACISMLAASLHLYLRTWETVLRVPVGDSFKSEFKTGWLNGYKAYFATRFDIDFAGAPADLSLLSEIVLARNRIQHPSEVTTPRASYSPTDLEKLPHAFFIDDTERGLFSDMVATEDAWLFPPTVHITEEKLMKAAEEVEKFCNWLDSEIRSVL